MTETTVTTDLPAATQQFILCWGDMGVQWGINRSIAQIHALLYLSPRPLHAEEIAETRYVALTTVRSQIRSVLRKTRSTVGAYGFISSLRKRSSAEVRTTESG